MTAARELATAWPPAVWAAPVLRGLDDAARATLVRSGRVVDREAGVAIYRDGDASEALYVVIAGAVDLHAVRRGDDGASVIRTARPGDSFGDEALLPGLPRRATAIATVATRLAEVPVAVVRRITGRVEDSRAADREYRYLERAAARDLLACSAFARELPPDDLEMLLDGARLERVARGERIYEPGDRAERMYFVVDGLVQLQRDASVAAYVSRGDFFGDDEALANAPRRLAAVAAGDTWCASVARDVVRSLADRNPGLLARLRRIAEAQQAAQADVIDAASARSTRHVFRDLYRMQMARSLLVIDQDNCVRCGHCAWGCEQVHGTSRLIRRGDVLVTELATGAATLLLPNTCQHCRHAACMIDCPTGAIGRDPEGEVFIRPSLCTGCGNCAKACPWDNIQMAPRPAAARGSTTVARSAEIAVKCDLCHGYDAPACVEACPTGAVLRVDPTRDIAEVAQILGLPGRTKVEAPPLREEARRSLAPSLVLAGATAMTAVAWAMHRARDWTPVHGAGWIAGVVAAALVVALAGYVIPKRRVRARMRVRPASARLVGDDRPAPKSRVRPHLIAHLAIGAALPAAVVAHAGLRMPASPGGALAAALAVATAFGALAALAYRFVPRALTRLERTGALPEDLPVEREALEARLYAAITGKSDRIKALADHVVLPYARARFGALALIASRRGLGDEERRLRAHVDRVLAGRRIDDSDELIRIAVELRALAARRHLSRALRLWLPLHVITAAAAAALLVVHVVLAVMP
jgi:Fe-S-cluster-containing dehydrogenase component/CRP-like cAMP-binding protein